jgi:LPXTG-motif cell wall-anchored protein
MGTMIGGTLLEIDNYALFVAAIGTNPVITGLVGITIAGLTGQAVWFLFRRKKSEEKPHF